MREVIEDKNMENENENEEERMEIEEERVDRFMRVAKKEWFEGVS